MKCKTCEGKLMIETQKGVTKPCPDCRTTGKEQEDETREAFEEAIKTCLIDSGLYINHDDSYHQTVDSFDLLEDNSEELNGIVVSISEHYKSAQAKAQAEIEELKEKLGRSEIQYFADKNRYKKH